MPSLSHVSLFSYYATCGATCRFYAEKRPSVVDGQFVIGPSWIRKLGIMLSHFSRLVSKLNAQLRRMRERVARFFRVVSFLSRQHAVGAFANDTLPRSWRFCETITLLSFASFEPYIDATNRKKRNPRTIVSVCNYNFNSNSPYSSLT